MSLKYRVGKLFNSLIETSYRIKPSLVPFIKRGIYVDLDILRSEIPIKTIFDVGANVGQSALRYVKSFPKSTIYSFEPVALTFNILKSKVSSRLNVICVNAALSEQNGSSEIFIDSNSEKSTLLQKADSETQTITTQRGDSFCNQNNITQIDILKIDVEGFEMNVLHGFSDISFVKFIYIECGYDKEDAYHTYFPIIDQYLQEKGFINAGFYDNFFWGKSKLRLGINNVLYVNNVLL